MTVYMLLGSLLLLIVVMIFWLGKSARKGRKL